MGLHFVQAPQHLGCGVNSAMDKEKASLRRPYPFVQAEGLEPTHLAALDPKLIR